MVVVMVISRAVLAVSAVSVAEALEAVVLAEAGRYCLIVNNTKALLSLYVRLSCLCYFVSFP